MEFLYSPPLCKIAVTKKPSSASMTEQFSGYATKPEDSTAWVM